MENKTTDFVLLYTKAIQYVKTSIEIVKLEAIEKTAEVVASVGKLLLFAFIFLIGMVFLSIGMGFLLGAYLNNTGVGFCLVALVYFVFGILAYLFRKKWIKNPLENLVVTLLVNEKESHKTSEKTTTHL